MPADRCAGLILGDQYLRYLGRYAVRPGFNPQDEGRDPGRSRRRWLEPLAAEIIGMAERDHAPLALVSPELKWSEVKFADATGQALLFGRTNEVGPILQSVRGRFCWGEERQLENVHIALGPLGANGCDARVRHAQLGRERTRKAGARFPSKDLPPDLANAGPRSAPLETAEASFELQS